MGKLNILHHKEWHVYSKANRDKVKQDEQIAEKEAKIENDRILKAESEAKLELLRKARGLPKDERLNLFENVQVEYQKTDKEIDQKKWEDKHTWYLGKQGDAKPWYASLSKREPDSTDSKVQRRKRVEEKRMRLEDPLTAIQKAKVTKHRHDPERGPRTRERLEREALEREASERNRLLELLGENRHQDQRQYYNSQFNPNLVKKH